MGAVRPLNEVSIRLEASRDATAVHALNALAFGRPDEARLVEALRLRPQPFVSLVAERGGILVGHIAFTPVTVENIESLIMGLAPMAVAPALQRSGIGSSLVRAGLDRCRERGAGAAVVLGHPEYYPKFGFVPAVRFGLKCEYDVPEDVFMALELRPGALGTTGGTVRYHPAFAEL